MSELRNEALIFLIQRLKASTELFPEAQWSRKFHQDAELLELIRAGGLPVEGKFASWRYAAIFLALIAPRVEDSLVPLLANAREGIREAFVVATLPKPGSVMHDSKRAEMPQSLQTLIKALSPGGVQPKKYTVASLTRTWEDGDFPTLLTLVRQLRSEYVQGLLYCEDTVRTVMGGMADLVIKDISPMLPDSELPEAPQTFTPFGVRIREKAKRKK
jgi:hypothetical protein